MLDKLYPSDMEGDQPLLLTTILTCEGDMRDPAFPHRLQSLVGKLKRLISEEKKPFCIKKVEPWNSVRVTFTIPWDAALRLRQLAQQGDQVLRDLGILSVQIEGDQAITLTLANRYNSEHQELVFKTSGTCNDTNHRIFPFDQETSNEERNPPQIAAHTIGQLLVKAINPPTKAELAHGKLKLNDSEKHVIDEKVSFQSPNVVAPSCSTPPPFKTYNPFSPKIHSKATINGGPFPFASMTHAMNTKQAAASFQNSKQVNGYSSRFPFTPPLQRSSLSAWLPYVSQKTDVADSPTIANVSSSDNSSKMDLISTPELQPELVIYSSINYGSVPKSICKNPSQNAVLSSPLLVNLLQNEICSKDAGSKEISSPSPTFQPPMKRRKKTKRYEGQKMPVAPELLNSPTMNWSSTLTVRPSLSPEICNNSSSDGRAALRESIESSLSTRNRQSKVIEQNPLVHSQIALKASPRLVLGNAQNPVSSHANDASLTPATTHDTDITSKTTGLASIEPDRLLDGGMLADSTPFPSPPPSADGKVKHLINPFTGQLEPMPSEDDDDDEYIGPLSLFPELEMMDTNENSALDKGTKNNLYLCNKIDDSKVPCSDDLFIEKSNHNVFVKQNSLENSKTITLKSQLQCEMSTLKFRKNEAKKKPENRECFVSNILLQGEELETQEKKFGKKFADVIKMSAETFNDAPKVKTVVTPMIKDNKLPCSAHVSQVDLSFLQPHLQKIKSGYKDESNAPQAVSEIIMQKDSGKGVKLKCFKSKLTNKKVSRQPKYATDSYSDIISLSKSNFDSVNNTSTLVISQKMDTDVCINSHNSQTLKNGKAYMSCNNSKTGKLPLVSRSNQNSWKEANPTAFICDSKPHLHDMIFSDITSHTLKFVESDITNQTLQVLDINTTCALPSDPRHLIRDCMKGISVSGKSEREENLITSSSSEKESLVSENLNISPKGDTCLSSSVCNTPESLTIAVSSEKDTLVGLDTCLNLNMEFSQQSSSSSETGNLKKSYEFDASPASSPHFETPPNSRSPISLSVSNSDGLSTDSIAGSFDAIQKKVIFRDGTDLQLVSESKSVDSSTHMSMNKSEKDAPFSEHCVTYVGVDSSSSSLADSPASCSQQSAIMDIRSSSGDLVENCYLKSTEVSSVTERKFLPTFANNENVSLCEVRTVSKEASSLKTTFCCNSLRKPSAEYALSIRTAIGNGESFQNGNSSSPLNSIITNYKQGTSETSISHGKLQDSASECNQSSLLAKPILSNICSSSVNILNKSSNIQHSSDSKFFNTCISIYGKPNLDGRKPNWMASECNEQQEEIKMEKGVSNQQHTLTSNNITLHAKSPPIMESCTFSMDASSSAESEISQYAKDFDVGPILSHCNGSISGSSDILLLSNTDKPKTYCFMDCNISKPPEQLPLEIFENSDSGSQSPASSEGESSLLSATSVKQTHDLFSVKCNPDESHLSSQVVNDGISSNFSETGECEITKHSVTDTFIPDLLQCNKLVNGGISSASASTSTSKNRCVVSSNDLTLQSDCVITTSVSNVPLSISSVPTLSLNSVKIAIEHTGNFVNSPSSQNSTSCSDLNSCRTTKCLLTPINSILINERNTCVLNSQALSIKPHRNNGSLCSGFPKKVDYKDEHADASVTCNSKNIVDCKKNQHDNNLSFNLPCTDELQNTLQAKSPMSFIREKTINPCNEFKGSLKTEHFSFKKCCNDHNIIFSKVENPKMFDEHLNTNYSKSDVTNVDEKLVNEIKHKLKIGKEFKLKHVLSTSDTLSSNSKQFGSENCVAIISSEKLEVPIEKSNYHRDLMCDFSSNTNYRIPDPVNIDCCVHQHTFEGYKGGSIRPEHTKSVCKVLQSNHVDTFHLNLDRLAVQPKYNGSLSFASLPSIDSKIMNKLNEGNSLSSNHCKTSDSCAIMDMKSSIFDVMNVSSSSEGCILTKITGDEQVGGIKRRRLSADSLR